MSADRTDHTAVASAPSPVWERLAVLASVVYTVVFTGINRVQFDRMLYKDFDLAVHAQTLWSLAHGSAQSSILGVHFLANHFIPLFYPLARLYAILPHPMTLLVLQSAALGAGGWLSFRVARTFVDPPWAALVSLVYLLHPAVGHANLYEFHPTTLAVPALLGMILAYRARRLAVFSILALAAMSCQENLPLAVGAFGLWAWSDRRGAAWVLLPSLAALGWLSLAVGRVQPALNDGTIDFWMIYSDYGRTPPEILGGLATRPWKVLGSFVSEPALRYLFQLLAPFLFLPLAGAKWALPALPFLFQHLLSSRATERLIHYHYSVEMMPFLVTASAAGLRRALGGARSAAGRRALALWLAVGAIVGQMVASPLTAAWRTLEENRPDEAVELRKRIVRSIPPGDPVVATFAFLPALSARSGLYSFHHVYLGYYTLSLKPYDLPADVRHAVIDLQDRVTFAFTDPGNIDRMGEFLRSRPWEVAERSGDLLWLRASETPATDELFCVVEAPEIDRLQVVRSNVDGDIQLVGFRADDLPASPEGCARVDFTLWWRSLRRTETDYGALFLLTDAAGNTVWKQKHHIGYRFFPTSRWRAGQHVRETFRLDLPRRLPEGPLRLYLAPVWTSDGKFRRFDPERAQRVDEDRGWVRLGEL